MDYYDGQFNYIANVKVAYSTTLMECCTNKSFRNEIKLMHS